MTRWCLILVAIAACRGRFDALPDAPADVGVDAPSGCIAQISAGATHACALRRDGTVQCWGYDNHGQLGNGMIGSGFETSAPADVIVPGGQPLANVTQISMGVEDVSCARRSDGTAWCWGDNTDGQLGDGTQTTSGYPVQVGLSNIEEIVSGELHTCARTGDGSMWCWGLNNYGQLGNSAPSPSLSPVQVVLPTFAPLTGVDGIDVSYETTCAWTGATADLYCWGLNDHGQVGDGSLSNRMYATSNGLSSVTTTSSAYRHTCATRSDGSVYCWGDNTYGQLGVNSMMMYAAPQRVQTASSLFSAVEVGAGDYHSCARQSDGSVWCWGYNANGQLGVGNATLMSALPVQVPLAPAQQLAVGNSFACALVEDNTAVACWGMGTSGQLGNGTFATSFTPVRAIEGCP